MSPIRTGLNPGRPIPLPSSVLSLPSLPHPARWLPSTQCPTPPRDSYHSSYGKIRQVMNEPRCLRQLRKIEHSERRTHASPNEQRRPWITARPVRLSAPYLPSATSLPASLSRQALGCSSLLTPSQARGKTKLSR